jgi:hypothetical protein
MRVRKWVDFGQEVDVEIGMEDVRAALSESFGEVTQDRLGEPGPNRGELTSALSHIATFLRALTAEHIALLNAEQRKVVKGFLSDSAERFSEAAGLPMVERISK